MSQRIDIPEELPVCNCGRRVGQLFGCSGCHRHPLDCGCLPLTDEDERALEILNQQVSDMGHGDYH